jgi:hypothetical protein
MNGAPSMAQWTGWLELVAEEAVLVAALLVVFEGCRRIVRDGFSRRAALMVALGLLPPVADAGMSLRLVKSVQRLQAEKMAAVALHGREPAGGWEKAASSPEARSALSSQAATVAYLFEGQHIDVVDTTGARVRFVAAPDQERAREQFVRDEKGAEDSARSAFEHGWRLFIEAAAFMLAGVAVGARRRRRD